MIMEAFETKLHVPSYAIAIVGMVHNIGGLVATRTFAGSVRAVNHPAWTRQRSPWFPAFVVERTIYILNINHLALSGVFLTSSISAIGCINCIPNCCVVCCTDYVVHSTKRGKKIVGCDLHSLSTSEHQVSCTVQRAFPSPFR